MGGESSLISITGIGLVVEAVTSVASSLETPTKGHSANAGGEGEARVPMASAVLSRETRDVGQCLREGAKASRRRNGRIADVADRADLSVVDPSCA